MIKSTVKHLEKIPTISNFPSMGYINEGPNMGMVVLLISRYCGVVVAKGTSTNNPVGKYSDSWHIEDFTPFVGSVTIESEA